MDFTAELNRIWSAAYPDEPFPPLADLSQLKDESDRAFVERLESLVQELAQEASDLEVKAQRKRFLCDFLDRLLLKLTRQQQPVVSRPSGMSSSSTALSSSSSVSSPSPQSPQSSVHPITSLPRVGKACLISPVVPRGTLIRVKEALRQSGLLLDTSDDEWAAGMMEEEDDDDEEEERVRSSRSHSVGGHREDKRRARDGTEVEGDDDSLEDYLYDALSDHEDRILSDREMPSVSSSSKPFPHDYDGVKASSEMNSPDNSDCYVSLESIKRKKEATNRRAPDAVGVGQASSSRNEPTPPPKKTLHDRLSYIEATWRDEEDFDGSAGIYEELSNLSTAVRPAKGAGDSGGVVDDSHPTRRRKDQRSLDSPTADRHGMACASHAEAAVRHLGTHEDQYQTYDFLSETSSSFSERDIDVTGEDRSNAAVALRLARATLETRNTQLTPSRPANAVAIVDHRRLLASAAGDPRRQELIHILRNEEQHLQILEILAGCQRMFLAHNYPSPKIEVVFKFVTELRQQQEHFVLEMATRLHNWTSKTSTADVFCVMDDYTIVRDYIANLPLALKTYEELTSERRDIADVIDVFSVQGQKIKFIDLMQQPVIWLTKSSENMKRVIQHTPRDHPDYAPLQALHSKLLAIIRSGDFGGVKERATSMIGGQVIDLISRGLVRHSLLVELSVGGRRKLRHVFLFPDLLVCAKPRPPGSAGSSFEVRWIVPTATTVIYKSNDVQSEEMRSKRKAEIETYKARIKQLRSEIKKEVDKERLRSSIRKWRPYGRRGVDKLKEQLHKTQAMLVLASPNLEFKISSGNDKPHILLMSSEFERRSWNDAVNIQKSAAIQRLSGSTSSQLPHFAHSDVQILLEEYKDMVSINRLGSCLLHDDQDGCLSGVLNVRIHRVEGLKEPIDCIVCVEVDSFEHFDLCAKTSSVGCCTDPVFDQEFDIELDFSTTVRFIVCRQSGESEDRYRNIAKLELRLDPQSLSNYQEKPHGLATFDDPSHSILLTLSLAHKAAHQTLSRQPSDRRGALFGVPLLKIVRRELRGAAPGSDVPQVPLLVRACTEELDRRALEEPGIYRISGMTCDVQKLRESFERNVTATSRLLGEYDVHVISGVLKAYLRELPDPLFTVDRYRDFMSAFDLSPIEAKRQEFIRLVNGLPEPNISCVRHLLRHFAGINRKSEVNKMVASNLGLIFGPTLLCPASTVLPNDILSVTMESFKQSGALTFIISLTTDGHLFAD